VKVKVRGWKAKGGGLEGLDWGAAWENGRKRRVSIGRRVVCMIASLVDDCPIFCILHRALIEREWGGRYLMVYI
jgi:hypothetical protein